MPDDVKRADLICIDDIGLLPVTTETVEALYRVVDAPLPEALDRAVVETSPGRFDELMPKPIANATVDRLSHHSHVVITNGDSSRLTRATRGKRVRPLTN